MIQAEKRAHHNALERKRRDHIKDSFSNLRESVPTLNGEKVSDRLSMRNCWDLWIIFLKWNRFIPPPRETGGYSLNFSVLIVGDEIKLSDWPKIVIMDHGLLTCRLKPVDEYMQMD